MYLVGGGVISSNNYSGSQQKKNSSMVGRYLETPGVKSRTAELLKV